MLNYKIENIFLNFFISNDKTKKNQTKTITEIKI